jgi:hypothetical protein
MAKPNFTIYNSEQEYVAHLKYAIDYNIALKNGRCFSNCFFAAVTNMVSPKTWRYTEGVAEGQKGRLYYHAWLTSRQGIIRDITWGQFDSSLYYPRYIFDAEKLFELAHDGLQKPFTRYIYKGHTKFKDAIIEEGVEHPSFDYSQWPTMGQFINVHTEV